MSLFNALRDGGRGSCSFGDPGELEPPPGGWHDTGDIVVIDPDGFVTIKGRAKRFAKIAGELVSLAAVEDLVSGLWADDLVAAIAAPDPKRGERVILATTHAGATRLGAQTWMKINGASRNHVPRLGGRARRDPAARLGQGGLYRAGEGVAGAGGVRTRGSAISGRESSDVKGMRQRFQLPALRNS